MSQSNGKEMEPQIKDAMEKSFGADLSNIRIHKDAQASETMGARAQTIGSDIFLHQDNMHPTPRRESNCWDTN